MRQPGSPDNEWFDRNYRWYVPACACAAMLWAMPVAALLFRALESGPTPYVLSPALLSAVLAWIGSWATSTTSARFARPMSLIVAASLLVALLQSLEK